MTALALQLHWRTAQQMQQLVLVAVVLPEWHGNSTLASATTALALLLLLSSSLMMARSLSGELVCALASSLLWVAMAERQKQLVVPGELRRVVVVGAEALVEKQKL